MKSTAAITLGTLLLPTTLAAADGAVGNDPAAGGRRTLGALPYLQGYRDRPAETGVVASDRTEAADGLNFYFCAGQPAAFLVDMRGNPVHQWTVRPEEIGLPEESHCRRAHLFSDGSILGIFEGEGEISGPLVKLDRDSRVIWIYRGRCHHDLFVDDQSGKIYVLTHRERSAYPGQKLTGPILEDFITILNPEGEEIESISLIQCFADSPYASTLSLCRTRGDIFHTNTVEVMDGSLAGQVPIWKKGRILISIRNLSVVALIDPTEEKVCWMLWGMWNVQHQPTVLEDGNILIFDNSRITGRSKVFEFDPLTQEIIWSYRGTAKNRFYSEVIGSCQRLANGNTLITESEAGRAFEVTPDNRIVWEFLNPHRGGKEGELIATLYELIRVQPGRWGGEPGRDQRIR